MSIFVILCLQKDVSAAGRVKLNTVGRSCHKKLFFRDGSSFDPPDADGLFHDLYFVILNFF